MSRRTPREIAAGLGVDQMRVPQAMYRALASMRYFARGYRYANTLAPARHPPADARPGAPGSLEEFAESHRAGPGLFKWRHYLDIYERHLDRFRGQDVFLVEVGIAGGGSLAMWRDYLGAQARLCGIDIDPQCRQLAGEQVEVLIADQGDPAFWREFVRSHGRIDIVVDDGGHLPHQQIATLEGVLPYIEPGGVYLCEDIHGPFQPFNAYIDGLSRALGAVGFASEESRLSEAQRQIASVHRYPILTVIEKNAWAPARFEAEQHGSQWPTGWDAVITPAGGPPQSS